METLIQNSRPRVAAAVLRQGGKVVLMVKHVWPDGREYWQFPGGGVAASETQEEAVLRELAEETGLVGRNPRKMFVLPYSKGLSTAFLVDVDEHATAVLGSDPEDIGRDHKKLAGLAWKNVADVVDVPEVGELLAYLRRSTA